jgi:general secretion pathway protein B
MSFILDAIAKSEQERQQQEVPGAQTLALPADGVKQPRRILAYFVIGALLVNAFLILIWMQSGRSIVNGSSSTQIENTDQLNEQAIVSDPVNSTDNLASIGVTTNVTTPEVVSELEKGVSTNKDLAESQSVTSLKTGEESTSFVNEPETLQLEPTQTTSDEDSTEWIHIGPDSLSNKAQSQLAQVPNVQNTSVVQREILRPSELPDDVRRDLPRVIFSGHLYSTDPKSSVVFIDEGRPVMKGRQITDDLFLHEITPTGVIVEFRGYLIEVGVLQNWTLN